MLIAMFLGLVLPGLFALITEEIESRKPQFRGRGGAIFALICVAAVILDTPPITEHVAADRISRLPISAALFSYFALVQLGAKLRYRPAPVFYDRSWRPRAVLKDNREIRRSSAGLRRHALKRLAEGSRRYRITFILAGTPSFNLS